MPLEHDGWNYGTYPEGGDCRKFVTLEQDGMCWVGIRAFHHEARRWVNNGEPEIAKVLAWRDLHDPARGRWVRGQLFLRAHQ